MKRLLPLLASTALLSSGRSAFRVSDAVTFLPLASKGIVFKAVVASL